MENVTYCTLTGQFRGVIGDTTVDVDGNPDFVMPQGTGTLTYGVSEFRISGATGTTIAFPTPVKLEVDSNTGKLSFNGQPYVILMTPNAYTNPSTWGYTVKLDLKIGNHPVSWGPHKISLPTTGTADLADLLPIADVGGVMTTQGPPGPSTYSLAVEQGKFTGTEEEFVDQFLTGSGSTANLTEDPNNPGYFTTTA